MTPLFSISNLYQLSLESRNWGLSQRKGPFFNWCGNSSITEKRGWYLVMAGCVEHVLVQVFFCSYPAAFSVPRPGTPDMFVARIGWQPCMQRLHLICHSLNNCLSAVLWVGAWMFVLGPLARQLWVQFFDQRLCCSDGCRDGREDCGFHCPSRS